MHSTSPGYREIYLNVFLSYKITFGSFDPVDEESTVFHPSRASLVPIYRPRRNRGLHLPRRNPSEVARFEMNATGGASSGCVIHSLK